ncbi:phosphoribosyltransferase family protein [Macrococcus brunensis]|uniref:phosphoribosyltransferase family protein n=1 Tax=Macrococcus brunensis TaxID=198483 RepID=UPI001EF08A40|nr:phosphoribosyltransferase family protein [Macrococcus brunensis]ULG71505.1 hypothetical protein MGG12_09240 [Macrococcus brunensis]
MLERDNGHYSDKTMTTISQFLSEHITANKIDTVVAVLSVRRPDLVPELARHIASVHDIDYYTALTRTGAGARQQDMHNSVMQEHNVREHLVLADSPSLTGRRLLLLDDLVSSRWTLTVAASLLKEAGATNVYPFALVNIGSD